MQSRPRTDAQARASRPSHSCNRSGLRGGARHECRGGGARRRGRRALPRGTPLVSLAGVVSHRPIALGCLLLLSNLACGGKSLDPKGGAGGNGGGAARDGGGGSMGEPCGSNPGGWDCINGCVTGHVLSARVCQAGAWVCPAGTVPTTQCAGTGDCPPSGGGPCTDGATGVIYYKQCSNGVWYCPGGTRPVVPAVDAGVPDVSPDGTAPATCAGDPFLCAIGTSGGLCGDVTWSALCVNDAWVCGGGLIPFSECRCSGPTPPGCTCGDAGLICSTDAGTD
jgi:hypothetical protein